MTNARLAHASSIIALLAAAGLSGQNSAGSLLVTGDKEGARSVRMLESLEVVRLRK